MHSPLAAPLQLTAVSSSFLIFLHSHNHHSSEDPVSDHAVPGCVHSAAWEQAPYDLAVTPCPSALFLLGAALALGAMLLLRYLVTLPTLCRNASYVHLISGL